MTPTQPSPARGRRTLLLIAAVCIAPVIASYIAFYWLPRDGRTNYGELLVIAPAPAVSGTSGDGKPFKLDDLKGQWVMVVAGNGACDKTCEAQLYATRQARTIQGRERERVQRVWLVSDGQVPAQALLAAHPDLGVVHVGSSAPWPAGARAIYLVDPLGNQVLAWPVDPDIKGVARDLTRLLRASRIG